MNDRNFDDLVERFRKGVYDSPKGAIRLAIVWDDLLDTIPTLEKAAPLQILDAGVGLGQMALRLARLGHQLVACDISSEMLNQTRELLSSELPEAKIEYLHTPVQHLPKRYEEQFDVVLFHAVLEWLSEPETTLSGLLRYIKPGGYLSLLFYNQNAIVWRNLTRGNFRKVKSGNYRGDPGGLTPLNPQRPERVYEWLEKWGLERQATSGVRVVYDYLGRELQHERSLDDIIEMERLHSRQEPFRSLGRYIHVICRAP
jgi:S-adenosylmethionine-dependent methyltransferase